MNSNQRLVKLRERTLAIIAANDNRRFITPVVDAASLRASENIESWQLRVGMRTRDRLMAVEFQSDELDLLAGRVKGRNDAPGELEAACEYLSQYPPSGGQSGHCEPYYEELFEVGIDGIRQRLQKLMLTNQPRERIDTWHSFDLALEGLSVMIENAALAVSDQTIAQSCCRIAHKPPATFGDALQLMWLVMLGITIGDNVSLVGPGRIDRRLIKWYHPANKQESLELLEMLYILMNDFENPGLAFGVMCGGTDSCGNDLTNDLSYLSLEALRRTRLSYPSVGVCWHTGTPPQLVDLALELIADGLPTAALFNDEVIRRGLEMYGVPSADSGNYINSTCVEITPCGGSNVWVASPYFNLCGILREFLSKEPQVKSFADFMQGYQRLLAVKIAAAVESQNELRQLRRLYGRKPLQSVFTNNCLARGRDIDDGGALYNWVECSFVGLGNLLDSLAVIRGEIFEVGELTLAELDTILKADFVGFEDNRQRFLHIWPKYGNDLSEVDDLAQRLFNMLCEECAKYRLKPDDSPFVPGAFCWVMHQRLGAETGATPDGRRAGFPFADGSGPAQGREKYGPTATIKSVTSWDHAPLIGGSALNMKFNKSLFKSPEALAKLGRLVRIFLERGGFEIQINVLDAGALQAARERPEEYRDLLVRIGGYTDYFTRLDPKMQEEVILRAEFEQL